MDSLETLTGPKAETKACEIVNDKTKEQHTVEQKLTSQYSQALKLWRSEIASYILALLTTAAIIWILIVRQGKPQPKWPGPFTLNFLVSTCATILKATLLMPVQEAISELKWTWFTEPRPLVDMDDFDLASRGARGSLRFLWRLPRNKLPSIGAVIIILALGIEPLTQLVVQPQDCPVAERGSTTLGRTNNYTRAGMAQDTTYPRFNLDSSMRASIYSGLLSSPEISVLAYPFDCSTGNCSFDNYDTLAICYNIDDISDRIAYQFSNSSSISVELGLPSGIRIKSSSAFATASSRSQNNWIEAGRRMTEDSPLFTFEALMGSGSCAHESPTAGSTCTKGFAVSVQFTPCIKTFNEVTVSKAQLVRTAVASTNLVRVGSEYAYYSLATNSSSNPALDCSPGSAPSGRKVQAANWSPNGRLYAVYDYPNPDDNPWIINDSKTLWYDPQCIYELGSAPTESLSWYLAESFFGYDAPTNQKSLSVTWGYPNVSSGDLWLEKLYAHGMANLTTISTFAENLANAMSATIVRDGDSGNSHPVTGTLLVIRTCVRIDWPWLILDLLLLPLSVFFFLAMLQQSRMANGKSGSESLRSPWKSSTLPLLWCTLEERHRNQHGTLNSLRDIKTASAALELKLVQTELDQPTTSPRLPDDDQVVDQGSNASSINDEEKGRLARSSTGRWTLDGQERIMALKRQNSLRKWGTILSDHIPI